MERRKKGREKQTSLPFQKHCPITNTSCEVFKNDNSAKSDSRATTESALLSPFQKAAFSESIFNVVSVILRKLSTPSSSPLEIW